MCKDDKPKGLSTVEFSDSTAEAPKSKRPTSIITNGKAKPGHPSVWVEIEPEASGLKVVGRCPTFNPKGALNGRKWLVLARSVEKRRHSNPIGCVIQLQGQ
jgi:hypothetical protein